MSMRGGPRGAIALAGCIIVLSASCGPREKGAERTPGAPPRAGEILVTLPLPGDDLPSTDDMALVRGIAGRIGERGAGRVVRTGGGMGRMEILVRSDDLAASKKAIAEILAAEPAASRALVRERPDG